MRLDDPDGPDDGGAEGRVNEMGSCGFAEGADWGGCVPVGWYRVDEEELERERAKVPVGTYHNE
jgi:hypothetical protein